MQEWRKPDIISKVYFLSYVENFMNHIVRMLFIVRRTNKHIYWWSHFSSKYRIITIFKQMLERRNYYIQYYLIFPIKVNKQFVFSICLSIDLIIQHGKTMPHFTCIK
jgi:hypothetical protein